MQQDCNHCNSTGTINKNNTACSVCHGTGNYIVDETIMVNIPKGVFDGYDIVFSKKGEQEQKPGEIPGDLVVKIVVDTDLFFTRNTRTDNNLIFKTKITLAETFIGKDILVPHFDGPVNINTNIFGIINPNKKYYIKGKGLCGTGDLIFVFEIIYPDKGVDPDSREILKDVFNKIGIN